MTPFVREPFPSTGPSSESSRNSPSRQLGETVRGCSESVVGPVPGPLLGWWRRGGDGMRHPFLCRETRVKVEDPRSPTGYRFWSFFSR